MYGLMNQDPAKLSLSNFLAGESDDPLQAPATFTNWIRLGAWAVELYEPELLATADARTLINYRGEPQPVINLCCSRGPAHAWTGRLRFAHALRNDRSASRTRTAGREVSQARGRDAFQQRFRRRAGYDLGLTSQKRRSDFG